MKNAKLVLGLALAGMAALGPVAAQADSASVALRFSNVAVDLDFGPPPARVEVVPAPRAGYIWSPGYWVWEDYRHVWVPGSWIVARPGYDWVGQRWERGDRGWHFQPGYWAPRPVVIREPVRRGWDDDHWGHDRDWRDHDWHDRDRYDHGWDRDRHDDHRGHWERDAYRGGDRGGDGGWHAPAGRGPRG